MPDSDEPVASDALATRLRLGGAYPVDGKPRNTACAMSLPASAMMFGAGALSGLLGIGSGAVKVIAMDRVMRIPFKVSTTTSNFMIGVTAAASAGLYLSRGYIDPRVAMPVMLGVLAGALLGAKVLVHARVTHAADRLRRRDSGPGHRNDRQRHHGEGSRREWTIAVLKPSSASFCGPAFCWPRPLSSRAAFSISSSTTPTP